MRNVLLFDLKEGMIVGRDVYTSSGLMVIPEGVVLTGPIIRHLTELGIDGLLIQDEIVETPVNVEAKKYFEKFNKNYTSVKDSLNNSFADIVNKNISNEDITNVVSESWKLFEQGNGHDMIGMLFSMHTYSDTTYMHSMNVGMIASLLGKWLGWSEDKVKLLNACGLFHDIGKLMIPKSVLDKPSRLDEKEYSIMQLHPIYGYKLLRELDLDERILNCAIMHHERCNGTGYPFKLTGDKIDDFAKVVAIADVYEAMTANRVYRGPVCPFDVIAQFEETGFDIYETKYLLVFLQNIVDSYLHSRVRLNNGETAEIVLINRQKGSKPLVITSSGKPVNLIAEPELKIEQVLG